jgi:hypothetical protein
VAGAYEVEDAQSACEVAGAQSAHAVQSAYEVAGAYAVDKKAVMLALHLCKLRHQQIPLIQVEALKPAPSTIAI